MRRLLACCDGENGEELYLQSISYAERVSYLIRQEYSVDDEMAIQRQRDTKKEEFELYNAFCEECKAKAKAYNPVIEVEENAG